MSKARHTRMIEVGRVKVGGDEPVVVQSMCATRTVNVDQTVAQVHQLALAGAGIVRIALDSEKEVAALKEIRGQTKRIALAVDLQENYKIAKLVAPHVDKLRYNPGHLHHIEKSKSVEEKVRWLASVAKENDIAIRIGVNCGSISPVFLKRHLGNQLTAMVESAVYHSDLMESLGFTRFLVSLKDSDPRKVVEANRLFAERRPHVPLHLGVTEAGLPPNGVVKTRLAFERLLSLGIGETIRVSLTLPNERKQEEVLVGREILRDIAQNRLFSPAVLGEGLNIISCPSCSRVENEKFVYLAEKVKELTAYAVRFDITIAVMGCRVNGPGETDDADLGLWCGPNTVNLKRKAQRIGQFSYDAILVRLKSELDALVEERTAAQSGI